MIYRRMFNISASHFNDEGTYQRLKEARRMESGGAYQAALSLWPAIAVDCHGHDFRVEIEVEGDPISEHDCWLIADEDLTGMVMGWDRINLSLLPEFTNYEYRATTERMAELLAHKTRTILTVAGNTSWRKIRVVVYETLEISAIVEIYPNTGRALPDGWTSVASAAVPANTPRNLAAEYMRENTPPTPGPAYQTDEPISGLTPGGICRERK